MKKFTVTALLAFLTLTGCASNAEVTEDASVSPSLAANPADPDATSAPKASEFPGFNEEIESAKVVFEVTNVTCGIPSVGEEPVVITAIGQFCMVRMTVTNNTKKKYIFIGNDQVLYDSNSTPYEMQASAAVFVNDSNALGVRIKKGKSLEAILPYDVPADIYLAGMLLRADSTVDGELMLFQNR